MPSELEWPDSLFIIYWVQLSLMLSYKQFYLLSPIKERGDIYIMKHIEIILNALNSNQILETKFDRNLIYFTINSDVYWFSDKVCLGGLYLRVKEIPYPFQWNVFLIRKFIHTRLLQHLIPQSYRGKFGMELRFSTWDKGKWGKVYTNIVNKLNEQLLISSGLGFS